MFVISRNVQRLALALFVILCPLVYTPGAGLTMREFQEHFFQLSSMGLISLFVGNIWMSLFMVWNIFLFYYNGASSGGGQVLNIFISLVLFLISRNYFIKSNLSELAKPILIVCAINLIWMAFQLFSLDPLFYPHTPDGIVRINQAINEPFGIFYTKSASGTFLSIGAIFAFLVNPILSILMIIPITLSKSSGVFVAMWAAVLFYVFYLYRRFFIYLFLASGLFFSFLVFKDLQIDPATFVSRFPMWHMVLKESLINPIGYGPDSFRKIHPKKNFLFRSDHDGNVGMLYINPNNDKEDIFKYYSPTNNIEEIERLTKKVVQDGQFRERELNLWDNPHNIFMTVLFEYGIIGLVLLYFFLNDIWKRFKNTIKSKELITVMCCLLLYFLSSFTQFPFHLARNGYLFPILLGVFYSLTDSKERII